MAEQETPKLHKDRNKILAQYAEQSFSVALDEINASLKEEKNITDFRYIDLRFNNQVIVKEV